MEPIEQSGSEKVDDNKDFRVSIVSDRKITTIIAYTIPASRKLLTISTKMILFENR